MSKKIRISLRNNLRLSLPLLFRDCLSRRYEEEYADEQDLWDRYYRNYYNDEAFYEGNEDYYYDDDGAMIYPYISSKKGKKEKKIKYKTKNKHNKHNKSKNKSSKARIIDINTPYDGYETESIYDYDKEDGYNLDDDGDYVDGYNLDELCYKEPKEIWFYYDYHYHDNEDKLKFEDIQSFCKYCNDRGYFIPQFIMSELKYRYESHCCLSSASKYAGVTNITSGRSYGDMFYEACDEKELSVLHE